MLSVRVVSGLLLVCLLGMSGSAYSSPLYLRLWAGNIDPQDYQPTRSVNESAPYFLLQLQNASSVEEREWLQSQGVELLEYIPDNAYLVRATVERIGRASRSDRVRWVGAVAPHYKYRPTQLEAYTAGKDLPLLAIVYQGEDAKAVAQQIEALGGEVVAIQPVQPRTRILFFPQTTAPQQFAEINAVMWLTVWEEAEELNDRSTWVVQSNVPEHRPIWDRGLHGQNQVLGHIDSRLDMLHCLVRDELARPAGSEHRKIVGHFASAGSPESHGIHTAGTAVGLNSDGSLDYAGVAYAAKLAHDTFRDLNGMDSDPSGFYDMLTRLHNVGARVHTNSWAAGGQYSYYSVDGDLFSWNHEHDLLCCGFGNSGYLVSPGSMKNGLAVGATRQPPEQDQIMFGPSSSYIENPYIDRRRKPDLYAPGRLVVSGVHSSCHMQGSSGTSMATPAVAGSALLVRQYYMEGYHVTGQYAPAYGIIPSGALIKATLLASTEGMVGLEGGYPSQLQGWGRLNLHKGLRFAVDQGQLMAIDVLNGSGLNTGQARDYPFRVLSSGQELRVSLAFTDYPAAYNTNYTPVNDLDLVVIAPGGVTYYGNYFSGGQSVPGGERDPLNNNEQVRIANPTPGDYIVRIEARQVNMHRQGFGVVVIGDVSTDGVAGSPTPAPPTNTPAPPSATPTVLNCGALVSQGRPAYASSSHGALYGPEKAVDGRIGHDERWVSGEGGPQWMYVDLGQPTELCQVRVYSDEAYDPPDPNRQVYNISQYTIRASNTATGDPSTWTQLAFFHDKCFSPYPDYPGEGVNAHNSHNVTGSYRYVAIHVTAGDGWCNFPCRLQELQVYAQSTEPLPTHTPVGPTNTPGPSLTPTHTPVVTELIVDNSDDGFQIAGAWTLATSATDKYGTDYYWSASGTGSDTASWSITLANSASVEVYAWWSQGGNRADNVPYTIAHAGGNTTARVNQQANGGQWNSLGSFNFNAGAVMVTLSNDANPSVVIADAVRFVVQGEVPTPTNTPVVAPTDTPIIVPTNTPTSVSFCMGDANRDGFVNGDDFRSVRDNFGTSECGIGDANGDCFVNGEDFRVVRDYFGQACP